MSEKELLDNGWKKEVLQINIQEYDETCPSKFRTLTYDMCDDFTSQQIDIIKNWANEINNRFPKLKVCIIGTGYYIPERIESQD